MLRPNKRWVYIFVIAVIACSCGGRFNLQKRLYRPNFYSHKTSGKETHGKRTFLKVSNNQKKSTAQVHKNDMLLWNQIKSDSQEKTRIAARLSGTKVTLLSIKTHSATNYQKPVITRVAKTHQLSPSKKDRTPNTRRFKLMSRLFLVTFIVLLLWLSFVPAILFAWLTIVLAFIFNNRSHKFASRAREFDDQPDKEELRRRCLRRAKNSGIAALAFFCMTVAGIIAFCLPAIAGLYIILPFLIVFALCLGSLSLAVIYDQKWHRMKLKEAREAPNKEHIMNTAELNKKARRSWISSTIFLGLYFVCLGAMLIEPPLIVIALILGLFAIIFKSREIRFGMHSRRSSQLQEKLPPSELTDEQESKKAKSAAVKTFWLSLAGMALLLLTILALLGGGVEGVMFAFLFAPFALIFLIKGFINLKRAYVFGKRVLKKHAGEEKFTHKRKSRFAYLFAWSFIYYILPVLLILCLSIILLALI